MKANVLKTPSPISIEDVFGPLNQVESHNAPEQLFACGHLDLLRTGVRVSVVGTRSPSRDGQARAAKVTRLLVEHGVTVVSGLAKGVDSIAHRTAIERGGRTIAVLGTPLDRTYPAQNKELQALIMRDHLAISQFPAGTATQRYHFPQRNRLMALVSHGTVIVEAGESSGTESQAWEALRLGREVFVLKSMADNPALAWVKKIIEYGAAIVGEGPDLVERLPFEADLGAAAAF